MIRESEVPGYQVDEKGLRGEVDVHPILRRVGIWRPLDVIDGELRIQQYHPLKTLNGQLDNPRRI